MKIFWYLKMTVASFLAVLLGGCMNFLVERANFNRMPVFMDGCRGAEGIIIDSRHYCATANTRLAGLADWISVPGYATSPGDFLLFFGEVFTIIFATAFIIAVLRSTYKKRKKQD